VDADPLQQEDSGLEHLVLAPDVDVDDLPFSIREQVELNLLMEMGLGHLKVAAEAGDVGGCIHGAAWRRQKMSQVEV